MTPVRRSLLLLACVAGGGVAGAVGWRLTGEQAWWLALPALVALGWLFVADPTRCDRHDGPGRH